MEVQFGVIFTTFMHGRGSYFIYEYKKIAQIGLWLAQTQELASGRDGTQTYLCELCVVGLGAPEDLVHH